MLVFCYLIVPATMALLLTRRFKRVLVLAALVSILITLLGLSVSFVADLPTNQTICVVACSLFLLHCVIVALCRLPVRRPQARE